MGAAELPAPRAEGSLATRPFAHLMLYVLQQRLDGTLVIWPERRDDGAAPRGQDRILLSGGRPVAGRFVQPGSTLDRSMLPLFTRVNAPYAFYEADLVGEGTGVLTGTIEPLALITASLRGAARDDAIDTVLRRLGMSKMRLRTGANLDVLGLGDKERSFIELIRAEPASVSELVRTSGNERLARRMLYLLTITRSIEPFTPSEEGRETTGKFGAVSIPPGRVSDPGRSSRPGGRSGPPPRVASDPPGRRSVTPRKPVSSSPPGRSLRPSPSERPRRFSSGPTSSRPGRRNAPEPPPDPPDALPDHLHDRWIEVAQRAVAIDTQNYFDMLGVGKTATPTDVRDAYFQQAKRWHPDRLPPELMPLRPWADRIFHYLTKAQETLANERELVEYRRSVEGGGGTPQADRHVNSIVEAAMEYQKAEVLVRRHDWVGALELLDDAVGLNPTDAEAFALRGHVLFHLGNESPPFDEALASLDRALELNESSEKAHLYKAHVLRRRGDEDAALRLFRRVVDINPRNTEAMREVRIANMRGKKSSGQQDAGLLSRLFGNNPKK